MEEIMEKFEKEFKGVYYVYLEASATLDSMESDHETYKDCDRSVAWDIYKRKSGQMYELRKVAEILGYPQKDIFSMEDEVINKYTKDVRRKPSFII